MVACDRQTVQIVVLLCVKCFQTCCDWFYFRQERTLPRLLQETRKHLRSITGPCATTQLDLPHVHRGLHGQGSSHGLSLSPCQRSPPSPTNIHPSGSSFADISRRLELIGRSPGIHAPAQSTRYAVWTKVRFLPQSSENNPAGLDINVALKTIN